MQFSWCNDGHNYCWCNSVDAIINVVIVDAISSSWTSLINISWTSLLSQLPQRVKLIREQQSGYTLLRMTALNSVTVPTGSAQCHEAVALCQHAAPAVNAIEKSVSVPCAMKRWHCASIHCNKLMKNKGYIT